MTASLFIGLQLAGCSRTHHEVAAVSGMDKRSFAEMQKEIEKLIPVLKNNKPAQEVYEHAVFRFCQRIGIPRQDSATAVTVTKELASGPCHRCKPATIYGLTLLIVACHTSLINNQLLTSISDLVGILPTIIKEVCLKYCPHLVDIETVSKLL